MKKIILMSAVLLSTSLLVGQTSNTPATVRIKKIEKINGIEKITDTTFTADDPASLKLNEGTIDIINQGDDKDGEMIKTIIIDDGTGERKVTEMREFNKEIDAEVEKALKEAGINREAKGPRKMVIIHDDGKTEGKQKDNCRREIIAIRRIDMTNATEADLKRIGSPTATREGKLNIENMNFYPNPNSGKFNLSFSLIEKGDAEINIMNVDGKNVYKEKLAGFSGNYDKEIDISKNAKGVYFVKVEQGKHSQVKKIVLE